MRSCASGLAECTLTWAVRHLSLESDQLGYDVSAPRIGGPSRLIEVKATTVPAETIAVYLSRNEAETGLRYPDWSLVVCSVTDAGGAREGEIVVGKPLLRCRIHSQSNRRDSVGSRPRSRWRSLI